MQWKKSTYLNLCNTDDLDSFPNNSPVKFFVRLPFTIRDANKMQISIKEVFYTAQSSMKVDRQSAEKLMYLYPDIPEQDHSSGKN